MQVLSMLTPSNYTFNARKRPRLVSGFEDDYDSHYLKKRLISSSPTHYHQHQPSVMQQQTLYQHNQQHVYDNQQLRHNTKEHYYYSNTFTQPSFFNYKAQLTTQNDTTKPLSPLNSAPPVSSTDQAKDIEMSTMDPSSSFCSPQEQCGAIELVDFNGTLLPMEQRSLDRQGEEESRYTIPNFVLMERSEILRGLSTPSSSSTAAHFDSEHLNTGQLIVYKKNPLLPENHAKHASSARVEEDEAEGYASITEITDDEAENLLKQQEKEATFIEDGVMTSEESDTDAMDID